MKKITTLLFCLMLSTACMAGCTNTNEAFTTKSYTTDNEQITTVNIDVSDRQIEILPSTDNKIRVDYFESSKEYYDIVVSDENSLTITSASNKEWTDYIGLKPDIDYRKISLHLPEKLLTTLSVSTTNENISLPTLAVSGDISLSSQDGNIIFDGLDAGNSISLIAKNGDITGSIIGMYEDYMINCDIKKGESNLPSAKEDGTKTLKVSGNNGNVDVKFVAG